MEHNEYLCDLSVPKDSTLEQAVEQAMRRGGVRDPSLCMHFFTSTELVRRYPSGTPVKGSTRI